MVQKYRERPAPAKADPVALPKRRGRPRAYQPDVALGQALELFRKDGFAATSLDDLSAATGMNRPSLYGAFGDKRELYIKSYARYRADARAAMIDIFRDELPIASGCTASMRWRSTSICRARRGRAVAYGDDGGVGSGGRPRHSRHGAGRICRTRPGVRDVLPTCQRAGRAGVVSRSAGAGAARLCHHPQHCDPRPGPGAAPGTRNDCEWRDRGDVRGGEQLITACGIDDVLKRAAGLETFDLACHIF